MIYLITGQNGHGKTVHALGMALEFQAEGRSVYVNGVRGMKHGLSGFIPLENPREWEQLPDGAVILVDECYEHFPNRNAASAVPEYIKALARHRHRGFDFILICQQMNQLDPFIKGLVQQHQHVRRKFMTDLVVLKTWDQCQDRPDKVLGDVSKFRWLNKRVYPLYESATLHTGRKSFPWYLYAAPVLVVAVLVGLRWITGGHALSGRAVKGERGAAASAQSGSGFASMGGAAVTPTTVKGWVEALTPVLPGFPYTAPIYAGTLHVQSVPRTFCGIYGDDYQKVKSSVCLCLSEQGTKVFVTDEMCRSLALEGYYDPFRAAPQVAQVSALPAATTPRSEAPVRSGSSTGPYIGVPYHSPDPRVPGAPATSE